MRNILTLILAPFSAIYLAYIFILRPEIAANTIGNMVGPYDWSESLHPLVQVISPIVLQIRPWYQKRYLWLAFHSV